NGMRRLSGISTFGNAGANQTIKFGEISPIARKSNRFIENVQQQIQQLVIIGCKFAGARVLGEVSPITIDANPNFEQSGLIVLNGPVSGRSECGNPLARP